MNDNFIFIDYVYRSRMTLLDILEDRGYEVEKYRKFSPAEASIAFEVSYSSLSFTVYKKEDDSKKCEVMYTIVGRQKLELMLDNFQEDTENVEIVIMLMTPLIDAHHVLAVKQYMKFKDEINENGEKPRRKLRVSIFNIAMLVINPLRHILVPKHEIVPEEEHKALLNKLYVTSKSKLPEIKYHIDPITRCIGAIIGDIIKITRPSGSCGEAIIYRVCSI